MALAVVVMGVSGCGKSSVGRRLARRLNADFADADDYHPPENLAKMAAGRPLNDADRQPWLERLHALIAEHLARDRVLVLACSALKERYRATLSGGDPRVHVVYLAGDYATIHARMRRRRGHYMKADMLRSQFEALEEPEDAIRLQVRDPLPEVLRGALRGLAARGVTEASQALARDRRRRRRGRRRSAARRRDPHDQRRTPGDGPRRGRGGARRADTNADGHPDPHANARDDAQDRGGHDDAPPAKGRPAPRSQEDEEDS